MQFLVETDILYDYLTHRTDGVSVLRAALTEGTCYTTMLNAMELFRMAESPNERDAIMNVLMVVRILGFNSRYAEPFAELAKTTRKEKSIAISDREAMILGMAQASKLTILTKEYHDRYATIGVVPIVNAVSVGS